MASTCITNMLNLQPLLFAFLDIDILQNYRAKHENIGITKAQCLLYTELRRKQTDDLIEHQDVF